jgi:hypothetical protein
MAEGQALSVDPLARHCLGVTKSRLYGLGKGPMHESQYEAYDIDGTGDGEEV